MAAWQLASYLQILVLLLRHCEPAAKERLGEQSQVNKQMSAGNTILVPLHGIPELVDDALRVVRNEVRNLLIWRIGEDHIRRGKKALTGRAKRMG